MQSLWMIAASFSFALMGVFVKLASAAFSAPEIVFYRSLVSVLIVLGLMRTRNVRVPTPHWRFQLVRSAAGFISLLCYFYAVSMLPLALAATLNYTSPLFLAIFLALFGKMNLKGPMIGSLVLGFLGVVLALRPTFHAEQVIGGVVGLASGVLAGLAYYNVKELGERGEVEERTVFYFALLSTVCSGTWMAFSNLHSIDGRGGLLLLGVAFFGTVGQLAMTRAYKRGNVLVSASLAYSTVIFASLFGMLFWQDALSAATWAAIALIVASGLVATWFSRANPAEQD